MAEAAKGGTAPGGGLRRWGGGGTPCLSGEGAFPGQEQQVPLLLAACRLLRPPLLRLEGGKQTIHRKCFSRACTMVPFSSAAATGRGQLPGTQALEQGQGGVGEAFTGDPILCTSLEGPQPAVKVRAAG